jgi:hypothetical protein
MIKQLQENLGKYYIYIARGKYNLLTKEKKVSRNFFPHWHLLKKY